MPWKLETGWHRGTITSRDSDRPSEHPTREAAEKRFQEDRIYYAQLAGMKVWFANLVDPDGNRSQLHPGEPYAR